MEDTDEVDDDKEDWNMDAEDNGVEESQEDEDEDEDVEADVGYNLTIHSTRLHICFSVPCSSDSSAAAS